VRQSRVDVRLSEARDIAAAWTFFRSAKTVTGITPTRVTKDGHDSYPRVIQTELGEGVRDRTNRHLNNRIELASATARTSACRRGRSDRSTASRK
jgi:transposase-like protein